MKIGITTTDGKTYILANEYVSVASAIHDICRVYSSASLMGVDQLAYLICEDDACVFVNKIVSVFEIKS